MSLFTQFAGSGGQISEYTQTAVLQLSQTVAVPDGTRYIEALLCGGGDGGGSVYSGGSYQPVAGLFGGLMLFDIPVLGASLNLVVGAGGAASSAAKAGGASTISINGTVYAAVGRGWPGCPAIQMNAGTLPGPARFVRQPLWSALPLDEATRTDATSTSRLGSGATTGAATSLATVTAWGLTGFAGGNGTGTGGGGGGGFLGGGSNGVANVGGAGGNGGGGGGAAIGPNASTHGTGGAGGNGFAILRFYS